MISDEAVEALAVVLAKEDLEWAETDESTPDLDTFLPAARRTAKHYLEAAAPRMLAPLLALADERDETPGAIRGHITTYELRQALGKVQP